MIWLYCVKTKCVEDHVEAIDYENAYFNEKYYLKGLKDGKNYGLVEPEA